MKKKSYKITCALKEGYSPKGKVHAMADAARLIRDWMGRRLNARQTVVSGLLQEGQLIFPAAHEGKALVTVSPTAVYYGELSSPEELKRKNKEVKESLESLARDLKTGLKQESVFITFRDDHWCV